MKTTAKKLQDEQDKIMKTLAIKLSRNMLDKVVRAINIEYKLTMIEEGHDSELEV